MSNDGVPLITDFGRSRILDEPGFYTSTTAGAVAYVSPELLCGKITEPDKPSDTYAFSMSALEVSQSQISP
jgi:serine/threonine protein kinase